MRHDLPDDTEIDTPTTPPSARAERDAPAPPGAGRTLEDAAAVRLLGDVLRACPDRVVAFDLDSTLLDNRPRSARIMREFGRHVGEPRLEAAAPEHWVDWSARRAMLAIGLGDDDADAYAAAHEAFWAERFFTSTYCEEDVAVPGAPDFARAVHEAGGLVVYLTGRPEPMREGTVRALGRLGFPSPGERGTELRMRTPAFTDDDDFKRSAITALAAIAPLAAAFDNEPTHVNLYRTLHPNAHSVHLATDHSGRDVALLDGIVSIRDFTAVPGTAPDDTASNAASDTAPIETLSGASPDDPGARAPGAPRGTRAR